MLKQHFNIWEIFQDTRNPLIDQLHNHAKSMTGLNGQRVSKPTKLTQTILFKVVATFLLKPITILLDFFIFNLLTNLVQYLYSWDKNHASNRKYILDFRMQRNC